MSSLDDRFVLTDGIYERVEAEESAYRRQWEQEAEEDHVVAAIARAAPEDSFEQLTAKVTPVWERIPPGARYGTILDVGTGYGRIALHLSAARGVTCSRFVAIDISRRMLQHLRRYAERFELFPGAELMLVRAPADELPLENASVDLAISSAVFLHMERDQVATTLREIARVLKPGGDVVFEASFPNKLSPANLPSVLAGLRGRRRPNQVSYYSTREVAELIERSGLLDRIAGYALEAPEHAVLPNAVAGRGVPLARRLNSFVADRGWGGDGLLGVTFTVTSLEATS
ncbi:MAG: class I SAM-dependent methyltransferase [Thermoleophilia bacterium]|nr:class I SAM-dependent methyltransferase [Thermoleophilia bacterium]